VFALGVALGVVDQVDQGRWSWLWEPTTTMRSGYLMVDKDPVRSSSFLRWWR
jgi:hypothetical protein